MFLECVSDSITECSLCGKKGLKKTFGVNDDGVINYYGSECVNRVMGVKLTKNAMTEACKAMEKLRRVEEMIVSTKEIYADMETSFRIHDSFFGQSFKIKINPSNGKITIIDEALHYYLVSDKLSYEEKIFPLPVMQRMGLLVNYEFDQIRNLWSKKK